MGRRIPMVIILSVALENHPGSLADILDRLASTGANIEAVEAEALGDFGNVRVLTPDAAKAAKALREAGFDVVEAEALELRVANRPGELAKTARKLAEAKVNVVSLFGTTPGSTGDGRLLLRVNNVPAAKKALGIK